MTSERGRLIAGALLTDAGRTFFKRGLEVLESAREVHREMTEFSGGRVRVKLGIASGVFLLATRLIRDLREQQRSRIELITVVANTDELLGQLAAGQIDLALMWDPGRFTGLHATRLCTGEHALILSPTDPLASRRTVQGDELKRCAWILTPRNTPLRRYVEQSMKAIGIYPRPEMEFGHAEVIKVAIEAGLGVSILARTAVEIEEQAGVLIARDISGVSLRRDLFLVRRKSRNLPRPLLDVAHFVCRHEIVNGRALRPLRISKPQRRVAGRRAAEEATRSL